MEKTKIDWCDSTWNPVTGCLHGCEYCYARGIAERFRGRGDLREAGTGFWLDKDSFEVSEGSGIYETRYALTTGKKPKPFELYNGKITPYPFGFFPTLHRYRLGDYANKEGRTIFVCSMADLFGAWVPDSWVEEVFAACEKAPQHKYLFLTKNKKRYNELVEKHFLPDQHWYGYSVTRQEDLWVFRQADDCKVKNLFVSIEPILEQIKPGFSSHCPADWVIIGAETGNRRNKIIPKRKWLERIVMECQYSGIPLFMKSSLAEIWGEPLIQEFPWDKEKAKEGRKTTAATQDTLIPEEQGGSRP